MNGTWKKRTGLLLGMILLILQSCGWIRMVDGVIAEETESAAEVETFGSESAEGMSIRERIAAPDHMGMDIQGSGQILSSDVTKDITVTVNGDPQIVIPDVTDMKVKKVKQIHMLAEDYMNLICALADEGSVKEDATAVSVYHSGRMTRNGVPYVYAYYAADGEAEANWLSNSFSILIDYYGVEMTPDGIRMPGAEKNISEVSAVTDMEYLNLAQEFIESIGINDFKASVVLDNPLSDELAGKGIVFEHLADRVPITVVNETYYDLYQRAEMQNEENLNYWRSEKLKLIYQNNLFVGMLYSDPMEITGDIGGVASFLSFEKIREIAGPAIIARTGQLTPFQTGQDLAAPVYAEEIPLEKIEEVKVDVKKIQLGYLRVRGQDLMEEGKFEGRLLPVWDFFCEVTYITTDEDGNQMENKLEGQNVSVLTLDAADGKVLTRKVGC